MSAILNLGLVIRLRQLTLLLLLGCMAPAALADTPRVLVSIQPIALIAQQIGGSAVQVEQLLPAQSSAHDYALKVSDQRRLREADMVVWIGPALESFLAKSLRNLPPAQVLELGALKGLNFPKAVHDAHADHAHGAQDFHIWLDPQNAQVMAQALAQAFIALAPEAAQAIGARAAAFEQEIDALHQTLAAEFAPLQARGFVVYHPGYDHLVARYGLTQLDFVALTPEQKAGARHMATLKTQLQQEAVCLLKEPYQKHARIDAWASAAKLRTALVYPLGREGVASYQALMLDIAEQMQACLAP